MNDLQALVTGAILGALSNTESFFDITVTQLFEDDGVTYLPKLRVVGNVSKQVVIVSVEED